MAAQGVGDRCGLGGACIRKRCFGGLQRLGRVESGDYGAGRRSGLKCGGLATGTLVHGSNHHEPGVLLLQVLLLLGCEPSVKCRKIRHLEGRGRWQHTPAAALLTNNRLHGLRARVDIGCSSGSNSV